MNRNAMFGSTSHGQIDQRNAKRKRSTSPVEPSRTTGLFDSPVTWTGTFGSLSKQNGSSLAPGPFNFGASCSGAYSSRARVGKPAPDFSAVPAVVDGVFREISLKSYKGKYLILLFYPLDFTYVCPTEIIAFSERLKEFQEIDCEVLACSVDSKYSHLAWATMARDKGGVGNVRIPLLSDITRNIARDYGVFDDELGHSVRGLFIIDPKGILRHITVNDLAVGRSVDESKRVLEALQFNNEYGDVCPADWKPGAPSIAPTPDDSREYFKLHHK
ncbi:peroxiredoxin-2-like [Paramacrobiotus metropolitanus]|uniref:peroxiredoxin-2-like n=1 Tax=Paramacrobiotus metropolitanus TaxID=2943436 RepID=UPI0024463BAB|nr:peroxiredoxin-2-like [Paramacrobiotus metropolitanus]